MLGQTSRALLFGIAVVCAAGLASAEPSDAAASFDRGLSLYKQGDFAAAARAFFRAYQKVPHAFSLYNAGLAWELAGDKQTAATAYALALAKGLDEKATTDANARLAKLSEELGRVEMTIPDGARIHADPFVLRDETSTFYLAPGRHRIRITLADDTPLSRAVEVEPGETSVLSVERPAQGAESDEPAPTRKKEAAESGGPDLETLGWVSLGVAAVAAGAAIVIGLETLDARDEYNNSDRTNRADREHVKTLQMWTNIMWATAAIAGVGGGVLILTASDDDKGKSAGVWFRGQF